MFIEKFYSFQNLKYFIEPIYLKKKKKKSKKKTSTLTWNKNKLPHIFEFGLFI